MWIRQKWLRKAFDTAQLNLENFTPLATRTRLLTLRIWRSQGGYRQQGNGHFNLQVNTCLLTLLMFLVIRWLYYRYS